MKGSHSSIFSQRCFIIIIIIIIIIITIINIIIIVIINPHPTPYMLHARLVKDSNISYFVFESALLAGLAYYKYW